MPMRRCGGKRIHKEFWGGEVITNRYKSISFQSQMGQTGECPLNIRTGGINIIHYIQKSKQKRGGLSASLNAESELRDGIDIQNTGNKVQN